ncbi:tryptophan-rich sensory protein [Candidatus Woesearchaeota archaeon]|nr:tryptophan-rich sensory protein [Candidatus Woesearchaeota archaeon]
MKKTELVKLIISILICQLAGIIGSIFTTSSVKQWYPLLTKPWFNPPSWVFAPVWTLLFLLMGISLYLIWKKKADKALIIFGIQLLLNLLWSILFFGFRSPFFAFVEIMVLWCAILLTIFSFYRINKIAAYLLIPYILWVSFASVLNLYIVILN